MSRTRCVIFAFTLIFPTIVRDAFTNLANAGGRSDPSASTLSFCRMAVLTLSQMDWMAHCAFCDV